MPPGCCSVGLGCLPIIFAAFSGLAVIATYLIAVAKDHVYPYLPTISYTGVQEPERNLFTLCMGISSMMGVMVITVRYMQFNYISEIDLQDQCKLRRVNKLGWFVGLISFFGGAIVASFQAEGLSAEEHIVGAAMIFIGGIMYFWTQTYLSYKMKRIGINSACLCHIRFVISILSTIIFTTCVLAKACALQNWRKDPPNHDFRKWQPGDNGYDCHVTSSITEWITFVLLLLYFLSFSGEFQDITFSLIVRRRDNMALPFETSHGELTTPLIA